MTTSPNINEHESITRVISHTIIRARETGADSVGQTRQAVEAVLTVRPDMKLNDVWRLVEKVLVG